MKRLDVFRGVHGVPVRPGTPVAEVNWPGRFPACPSARCGLGYDEEALLLEFAVEEREFRAVTREDNGRVWEDSCVEFFFQPEGEKGYYNFECNAIGTLLCTHGTGRDGRRAAAPGVLATIRRKTRVEVEGTGEERTFRWWLSLEIPFTALFYSDFRPRPGMTARGNFYKCGDLLPVPHFLSWNPVGTVEPDFHRPEYFGVLTFHD
jgi:hypothetical protein